MVSFTRVLTVVWLVALAGTARADDGYRLWLRYDPIEDEALRRAYAGALTQIVVPEPASPTVAAARDELVAGLEGLLATKVPVANRVGEENNGWYVAMTLLDFERSNVASIAANQRVLEELGGYLRGQAATLAPRDILRHRLADLWIANDIGRLLSYRIAWMQESGRLVNVEASVIKVFATELAQRIANAGVNLQGATGGLVPGSPRAALGGMLADDHLSNVSPTIYSGSSEIQRNIIATRGLGLPRD